jgi:hypothetical protein
MKTSQTRGLKRIATILLAICGGLATVVFIGGCSSVSPSVQPSAPVAVETPSPLSYGAITATVKKGVTTQAELVTMFGGPNIATLDSDGTESWVYERTISETSTTTQDTASSQARSLDVFFGLGLSGKDTAATQSSGRTTVAHSIKSLTVIIKFNQDKTVKDFSARSSYF